MAIKKNITEEKPVEVKKTETKKKVEEKKPKKYKVGSLLNFRTNPDKNSNVIRVLKPGEIIEVESIENGWAKVTINKTTGYVMTQFISAE